MEILDSNLTTIIIELGLIVTAMVLMMLVIITIVHWQTDRRLNRSMLFDRLKRPMIMSYLEGHTQGPSLIEALEKKPAEAMRLLLDVSRKLQPEVRALLLPIFAGLPGVDQETEALRSPLTKRRITAAERLSLIHNESAEKALLVALGDQVLAVRYSAAYSLAEHGKPEHIEPTLLAFDAEHEINWYRLVEIMTEYGSKAIPTLLRIIDNSTDKYSPNMINVAIRALGLLKEPQAVQPLIGLMKHPDFSIRLNASHALGDIGDPSAAAALAQLSHDPDWMVRVDALEAIGKLHASDRIPELTKALADSSWWVRYTAANALHSIGDQGIKTLWETMRSTDEPNVYNACRDVLSEHYVLKARAERNSQTELDNAEPFVRNTHPSMP